MNSTRKRTSVRRMSSPRMSSPRMSSPRMSAVRVSLPSPPKSAARIASPRNGKTIVDIAVSNPDFSTLVSLLKRAGLVAALQKPGNFTVFAPTNKAFEKLDKKVLKHLTSPEGLKDLKDILLYHVVPAKITSGQITGAATPKTLQGKNLCVFLRNGKVKINDGQVIKADILGSNGVIHVVDTVLTPLNDCSKY